MADDRRDENSYQQVVQDRLQMDAHDLKAPISNIINICTFLIREDLERENVVDFLGVISENARTMHNMVLGLLHDHPPDSSPIRLQPAPLDLVPLIQSALNRFTWVIQHNGLDIVLDIPDSLPPLIGDRDLLSRVFQNLLDNAIRHSPAKGEIRLLAEPETQGVRFDVMDRGDGVPEEIRDRIFEKFFAHPQREQSHHPGGVGLSFCQLVVEAHGGRIWVSEREGGGSIFSFVLPSKPVAAKK